MTSVKEYLLNINVARDASVPLEVYIAFPETLRNPAVKEQVRKMWLYGNDKQVASMDLMFADKMACICRPNGMLIDWVNIQLTLYTSSGLAIVIPNVMLSTLGSTTEERIANLNDYLHISFAKRATEQTSFLQATDVTPLRGKVSVDVAKAIIESGEYSPYELLLLGLGYKPTKEVKRLFLPRVLTWFKGFDGKPMHVAQFTLPESGKTSFAVRTETLFNWRYIPEPPTLARLILDARSGILGEVFLRNGIVFDEFDKWSIETADRRYTFDSILTGMEQGKWERGVSAMGIRVPDVPRLIPILFFGNLGDFQKLHGVVTYNTRAWFNTIYTARLSHDVRALCDRLCVIDACFKEIRIMDYLTYEVLPDSVLRGIVALLQEQVKPCDVSKLRGRIKRHANNLYVIMSTLFKNVTPEMADSMASGMYEFDKSMDELEEKEEAGVPKRE